VSLRTERKPKIFLHDFFIFFLPPQFLKQKRKENFGLRTAEQSEAVVFTKMRDNTTRSARKIL